MPAAPLPANEESRIAALHNLKILDTDKEERFDRITTLTKFIFNVPIVVVSLVDTNRQWFKSCIGLPVSDTPRKVAFCAYAILQDEPLIIPDATKDERFADNELVTGEPFIRFYAGVPLVTTDGSHIGTLCIIDRSPRTLTPTEVDMLKILAKWVEREISMYDTSQILDQVGKEQEKYKLLTTRTTFALESAKIGIWEWKIPENQLVWDTIMYDLYGTNKEDFSGAYDAWQKGLHPDDKKRGDEEIQLALGGVKDFDTNFRVVWPDHTEHILRAIASVERDDKGKPVRMVGVNWDITKEKSSERDLQQFKAIIRDSTDAIIGNTTKGIITSWNEGAQNLYGYTSEEIVGKSIRTIVPPENDDVDQLLLKVLQGERIANYETVRKHKDGHLIDVSITISPIHSEQGVIIGVSVVARDISKQKRLEGAQSEFVSLASHQLRTPLTAIKWIVSTLADGKMGPLQDQQKDVLKDAKISVDRMNETISTMLMISRIETNNLPLEHEPLSIQNILGDLQNQMKNIYESKKQQVTIDCPVDVSLTTDRKVLIEILTNLMSNAVKYTPDGGNVLWKVKQNASSVTFDITDSGYGIPNKDKDRIFTRFFRAENVKNMQTEGTGLGLYLVASLVKVLGGTISFTSVENKGTTFTCIFPLTPPSHATDSHR